MKRTKALINKETLFYIFDGKKVTKQYMLKNCKCKPESLDSWLDVTSETLPTIQQAKKIAKCLHIPFAAMYMNRNDIKLKSIPSIRNFRTVLNPDNIDDSLLNLTIIDLLTERDFLIEAKKELGINSELFCPKVPESNSPKIWADKIRQYFSLDLKAQYDFSNARQFYLYLRSKIEKKGIFIQCFKGLEIESIRGIAIYDNIMPVIGINNIDRHPGKIFSILHEIVHIYKRQSSFCNAVAGEVLVPTEAIQTILNDEKIEHVFDMQNIEALAKRFSVSREVIIRRLYDMKEINQSQYELFNDIINKECEDNSEKKQTTRKNPLQKLQFET